MCLSGIWLKEGLIFIFFFFVTQIFWSTWTVSLSLQSSTFIIFFVSFLKSNKSWSASWSQRNVWSVDRSWNSKQKGLFMGPPPYTVGWNTKGYKCWKSWREKAIFFLKNLFLYMKFVFVFICLRGIHNIPNALVEEKDIQLEEYLLWAPCL